MVFDMIINKQSKKEEEEDMIINIVSFIISNCTSEHPTIQELEMFT